MVSYEQKFKVGDRVRRLNHSHGVLKIGEIGTVAKVDGDDIYIEGDRDAVCHRDYNLELVEQRWQPKVGDRVRMKREVDGNKSDCGATVIYNDGSVLQPIAIKFDERQGFAHTARGHAEEGFGYWVEADDIERLPITTDVAITIKSGKFYKTRDGRKVGPAFVSGRTTTFGERSNWASAVWTDNGRQSNRSDLTSETPNDIIAEWVDEPAAQVKVANDNSTPKFKVGDVVKFRDDYPSSVRGKRATVMNVSTWGVQVDLGVRGGISTESPRDLVLISSINKAQPTAIVALIENGQPLPSQRPYIHATVEGATTEANRLAGKHKGQEFGVYVLQSTAKEATPTYKHEWQRLAAKGEKIQAIKELRSITGLGLKATKDALEYWLAHDEPVSRIAA